MNITKRTCQIIFMLSISYGKLCAQNFNYQLTKDSTAYSSLTDGTTLISGQSFVNKRFTIPIPFSFNFCGSATDSVIIETNGFIVFDKAKSLSLVSFNGFGSNKDSTQNYTSSIKYSAEGTIGNRIVKIEFQGLSNNQYSYLDNLSYQVWLYESGSAIEFHIGSNSYFTQPDKEFAVLIGLINQNMNTENKAYLISGNPTAPAGQMISGDDELTYLNSIPAIGVIYKLLPIL